MKKQNKTDETAKELDKVGLFFDERVKRLDMDKIFDRLGEALERAEESLRALSIPIAGFKKLLESREELQRLASDLKTSSHSIVEAKDFDAIDPYELGGVADET